MKDELPKATKSQKSSGMTLIELLVVFTVIAILGGVGIASFVSYSRSQEVNQIANNVKLLINEAKFNSLNSVKTAINDEGEEISCGTQALIGYRVDIISPRTLRLYQVCQVAVTNIKTITFPQTMSFGTPPLPSLPCTQIGFTTLSTTASGVPLPCKIKITGLGAEKTVSIDAIGNINVE